MLFTHVVNVHRCCTLSTDVLSLDTQKRYMPSLAAPVCRMKLTSASWLRPVCGGFHNLFRFNCAPFIASRRRHRVLTVTYLDACRCAAYLTRRPPFSPRESFVVLISVKRLSLPQGHNVAGSIRSVEKYNGLIGNRTRDLPACNIVPLQTTLRMYQLWSHYP
jgi:hypothetical protein